MLFGQRRRVGARLLGDRQHHARGSPLTAASPRLTCAPSTTRATCRSSTGRSAVARTTTSSSSSMVWMRPSERTRNSLPPRFEIAAGGVVVAFGDGVLDLGQRDTVVAQAFGIDEHLELLAPAAHRHHLRDAGNRQEPLPHHPVGQRAKFHRAGLAPFAPHADTA